MADWSPLFLFSVQIQSTCGVSVVRDYYKLKKFNVLEIVSEGRGVDAGVGSG